MYNWKQITSNVAAMNGLALLHNQLELYNNGEKTVVRPLQVKDKIHGKVKTRG